MTLGCAPLSPAVPFHLMETSEVLAARKVSLGFTAGAGGLAQEGWGTGATLRARVGTGARQEVGLEGGVLYATTGGRRGTGPPWAGESNAYGLRLSWKLAPLPWLATLVGLGASSAATGAALSPDLGLVVSPGRPLLERLRPFGGARAFFAFPVARARDLTGGVTAALVLPVGLSYQPARSLRLLLEAGGLVAWSSLGAVADPAPTQQPPPAAAYQRAYAPSAHGGYYGAVGVVFVLERNSDSENLLRSLNRWR